MYDFNSVVNESSDGGTDSLMFGNESGLGTPSEDMSSIAAVYDLKNVAFLSRSIVISLLSLSLCLQYDCR